VKSYKPKTSFGAKGSPPAGLPKSQQIGKCASCGDFKRLPDLENGVCKVACKNENPAEAGSSSSKDEDAKT
jgi:hypothetical protein